MDKLRRTAREFPLMGFLILSIGISWPLWGLQLATPPAVFASISILPYFGPLFAAAVLIWLTGGDLSSWASQIVRWRIAPHWYGFALVLPLLCGVGVVIGSALLANAPWRIPFLTPLTSGRYVLGLISYIIYAIGLEAGFRGFALPQLQQRYNALVASVILGVAWSIWSLPQLLFPGSVLSTFSIFAYVPALIVFSVLLTYIYNSTSGSILATAVLGGGIQTAVGFSVLAAPNPVMQAVTLAIWAIPALTIANLYGAEQLAKRLPSTNYLSNTADRGSL